jgi:hypothetical protein
MKATQIRLSDTEGKVYRWTIRRVPRAWNCLPLGKSHYIHGWEFADHDGVVRFAEGNWQDLVALFHLTASNYGFTLMSELS